ncbi:Fimbrial protein [Cronobacter dublinensis 1210]|uniref:Fimbrial protein n=1 Tax=Cronobacter dublinensis 1210 TaxID=1208656 RepID=A0ABM9QBA7_9ENTR|nr:fimbrial protein [Cronobacter dublinensis]CCJ82781.1 Fimbrial protein [Cronobacter dublinensis 1210]ALB68711.1 fimbrial protein [Cronobacter dublinensis subsp. dublinensis LMG 23823]EKY3245688.1 fimbrial protein [Cronobacter dublinensis]ELQ6134461.1 fimbrial protein [Cronobacter dublinensis]ELQ6172620.1 fimbrial protein [Cronobacter dublinensis]
MKRLFIKSSLMAVLLSTLSGTSVLAADTPATLHITGQINAPAGQCKLYLSENTISLDADLALMDTQETQTAANPHRIHLRVDGDADCEKAKNDGKIEFRFYSDADTSRGNAIRNTAEGEGAAQGVAIGLYDNNDTLMTVNQSTLPATEPPQTIGLQIVKLMDGTPGAGAVQGTLTIEMNKI